MSIPSLASSSASSSSSSTVPTAPNNLIPSLLPRPPTAHTPHYFKEDAIDPQISQRFCSACRKQVDVSHFTMNRKICNRHHSTHPIGAASIASPESALYQMRSMNFCQNFPHKTDQKKVLDIYVDYDALIDWLDQRKDVDPRVDRVRRIPKENDLDLLNDPNGQITLARRHATREARRVRDFIFIGTGLLFIHKTVAVGQKLQWTCQSRCSQSDRLKGGRDGIRRHGDPKRPSTSRTRYPCQGTTTVSLLHQQPGQRRLLHLVIKHAYVHGPHDDRNRESALVDLSSETDFQVIDPALRNCLPDRSPRFNLVGSSSSVEEKVMPPFTNPDDGILGAQINGHSSLSPIDVSTDRLANGESSYHQPLLQEINRLLSEDEDRNQLIKKIILDQQLQLFQTITPPQHDPSSQHHQQTLVQHQIQIMRDFFRKRSQIMDDLEPILKHTTSPIHPDFKSGDGIYDQKLIQSDHDLINKMVIDSSEK